MAEIFDTQGRGMPQKPRNLTLHNPTGMVCENCYFFVQVGEIDDQGVFVPKDDQGFCHLREPAVFQQPEQGPIQGSVKINYVSIRPVIKRTAPMCAQGYKASIIFHERVKAMEGGNGNGSSANGVPGDQG